MLIASNMSSIYSATSCGVVGWLSGEFHGFFPQHMGVLGFLILRCRAELFSQASWPRLDSKRSAMEVVSVTWHSSMHSQSNRSMAEQCQLDLLDHATHFSIVRRLVQIWDYFCMSLIRALSSSREGTAKQPLFHNTLVHYHGVRLGSDLKCRCARCMPKCWLQLVTGLGAHRGHYCGQIRTSPTDLYFQTSCHEIHPSQMERYSYWASRGFTVYFHSVWLFQQVIRKKASSFWAL